MDNIIRICNIGSAVAIGLIIISLVLLAVSVTVVIKNEVNKELK